MLLAAVSAGQLPPDDPAFHSNAFHCPPATPDQPDFGEAIAWLAFPRFALLAPVYEGIAETELQRGIGHVEGTALPGVPDPRGNCVVAAHRTMFFSPLESAVPGDRLALITASAAEEYVVERILIVTPDHVELEAPTQGRRLTLVTCTPFNYLGSAPYRFVVIATPRTSSTRAHRPPARKRPAAPRTAKRTRPSGKAPP
jgi:sortase A